MPALTIDGSEVHVVTWREEPEYPTEEASPGFGRTIRSAVTDARPHRRVIHLETAPMDRDDAQTLEATLATGTVTIAGDLPGEELTARVHDLTPIEDPEVLLYGAVSCTLWIDPPEAEG